MNAMKVTTYSQITHAGAQIRMLKMMIKVRSGKK